jgi:GNAT superfamily N-acetyltransferase
VTPNDLVIRRIEAGETLPLRSSVLWPGASQYVNVLGDDSAFHFGAFLQGGSEPISIISLFIDDIPEGIPSDALPRPTPSDKCARFRKFATHWDFQGKGVGSYLLSHACEFARTDLKAKAIWCSARTASLGWYQKRGLEAIGERWMKGGHEYVKMVREL